MIETLVTIHNADNSFFCNKKISLIFVGYVLPHISTQYVK